MIRFDIVRDVGVSFCFESYIKHPIFSAKDSEYGRPYVFPLRDPELKSTLVLGHHQKRYMSKAARNFIALTQEIFSGDVFSVK